MYAWDVYVNIWKLIFYLLGTERHKFIGEKMFFFTPRERKYPNRNLPKRLTGNGYWKGSGKYKPILEGGHTIGYKKALMFYEGRVKKGRKTNWLMDEYTINAPTTTRASAPGDMKVNYLTLIFTEE